MRWSCDSFARVVATALSALPFMIGAARGEIVSGIGVSGSVEYASNPYLLDADDAAAARGRISISPFVEERTARSSLRVSADAGYSVFNRRYRDAIDLSSGVAYRNMLTRQLSVRAGVTLNSSIGGSYNVTPLFALPSPTPVIVQPIIDITVVGSQERTTQVASSLGASYAIDGRNSFNLDFNGSVARFPGSIVQSDYSSVSQSLGYSRVINSRISAGASVSVSRVNYFGGRIGDAVTISPSINGNMRLNSRWSLTAGVGLSSSRVQVLVGKLTSNDLSGNVSLCRTDVRTNFCLNASRGTGASSIEGLRTTTSLGASYSYQLSARDSLSASGGYTRSSATVQQLGNGTVDYLTGNVSLSRRFSDRISGSVSGGFNRSGFEEARSNAYGSIGISYNFGRQ